MAQQAEHSAVTSGEDAPALTCAAPMGTEVRANDGERLGQVAAAWPRYLFVESQPGASAGYWVPVDAIAGDEDGALVVGVSRIEAERQGWTERPPSGPEAL
jgi:hypothetical protein